MSSRFNKKMLALAAAAGLIMEGVTMAAEANGPSAYPQGVVDAIYVALDDEYRAASFYEAVLAKFGEVRPFINIVDAERRHARRLTSLLEAASAPIPPNPYATGEKSAPSVPATLNEACRIGVEAEIENAALYDGKLIPAVKGFPEVEAAMRDLRAASQDKHLPAFQRCVERGGRGGGGRNNR